VTADPLNLISIRMFTSVTDANQHALVLNAVGIRTYLVNEADTIVLYVAMEDAGSAVRELAAYDEEEAARLARRRPRLPARVPGAEAPLIFVALMTFCFAADRASAFGQDWGVKGAAQVGAILHGEWWRTVTSLFLHADGAHLLGNLGMGIVVGLLLAQILGSGVAWLAILASGVVGNLLNASLQPLAHTAIGASTAVFGGIGLLAGFSQASTETEWHRGMRRWAPLAAGLALLVLLGTAGENTDIWAHVCGFVAGGVMGLAFGRFGERLADRRGLQAWCGAVAVAAVAAAWIAALRA
jgi:membrane associated rhomboid family serine protease